MTKTKARTDPHRPSALDPADYVFVGVADDHPGDSYLEIDHKVLAQHGVETGVSDRYSTINVPFYDAREDGRPNFRCHHCGKHGSNIRYFILFLHKPTKKVVVVGRICAKKLSLATKSQLDIEGRAADFRRAKARATWADNHPDVYDFLKEYSERDFYAEFLDSLWERLQRYGYLTAPQVEGVRRWMAKGKPWQRAQGPKPVDPDRHAGEVVRTTAPPTEAQVNYLHDLSGLLERTITIPDTRIGASKLINDLKAEAMAKGLLHKDSATSNQVSFINKLMDERQIPLEKRREARQQLDAGLTKEQANRWIQRLKELPKLSE